MLQPARCAVCFTLAVTLFAGAVCAAQDAASNADKIKLGSQTAKNGFKNEADIRDKFNNWKTDTDARQWLIAMKYKPGNIRSVVASRPHGQKADVEVIIDTGTKRQIERISIKLVSSSNGFNQIDKRWLQAYSQMWKMPESVSKPLGLFVGETPPHPGSRHSERMYLNELPLNSQKAVLDFFATHKSRIVSDLLAGNDSHAANWFMVTLRSEHHPRWVIRSMDDAIRCFSHGEVVMTRAGNLKIGRIGMQRKGGDNGRETAKMLQFKINPVQLFAELPEHDSQPQPDEPPECDVGRND